MKRPGGVAAPGPLHTVTQTYLLTGITPKAWRLDSKGL